MNVDYSMTILYNISLYKSVKLSYKSVKSLFFQDLLLECALIRKAPESGEGARQAQVLRAEHLLEE